MLAECSLLRAVRPHDPLRPSMDPHIQPVTNPEYPCGMPRLKTHTYMLLVTFFNARTTKQMGRDNGGWVCGFPNKKQMRPRF